MLLRMWMGKWLATASAAAFAARLCWLQGARIAG